MYYETLFRRLNDYRVKYVVCGGLAVMLHGVPRTTADIDILIDGSAANRSRLWDALSSLGHRPVRPVSREQFESKDFMRWLREEKHAIVFSFAMPGYSFMTIDILIESPVPYNEARKCAKQARMGSLVIPVVSIPDLIRMKRRARREQDISDIRALKKVERVTRHAKRKTQKR